MTLGKNANTVNVITVFVGDQDSVYALDHGNVEPLVLPREGSGIDQDTTGLRLDEQAGVDEFRDRDIHAVTLPRLEQRRGGLSAAPPPRS